MKLYRNLFWWTLGLVVITFVLIIICSVINFDYAGICLNLLIGIFASALLLFINSIIGYLYECKKRVIGLLQCLAHVKNVFIKLKFVCWDGTSLNVSKITINEFFILTTSYLTMTVTLLTFEIASPDALRRRRHPCGRSQTRFSTPDNVPCAIRRMR